MHLIRTVTHEKRVREVSAMIAPLLRCLGNLIDKVNKRYTDPLWLVPECGKIILH